MQNVKKLNLDNESENKLIEYINIFNELKNDLWFPRIYGRKLIDYFNSRNINIKIILTDSIKIRENLMRNGSSIEDIRGNSLSIWFYDTKERWVSRY